jgi:hypothetical protein
MQNKINKNKRGPNKIQNYHTSKESYLNYIKDILEGNPYYVTYNQYSKITGDFYKELINRVIVKSHTVILPNRMGSLTVMKKKPKVINKATVTVDWENTLKYGNGHTIRFINDHTKGFKFRFVWNKSECMCVNRSLYRLVLSRGNKRFLAKCIKEGTDYIEMKK